MNNSSLVNYTRISPNRSSPRNHIIDTISIHCVAGNCTVETIGNIFGQPGRQASSNYGVGSDGRIGLYCDENDRSWCTSSASNDNRAVTIEVANDSGAPEWHVTDVAMTSLIKLIADICKRNNIKQLLWKGNKNLIGQIDKQNMTVHQWFANKSCPGEYLYSHHDYIATEVNKILNSQIQKPQQQIKDVEKTIKDVEKTINDKFEPYKVSVKVIALNVRKGPGTDYPVVKTLMNDKNVYTIVEEANGPGASKWCKLKSDLGWVSKDFMKKI